MVIVTVEPTSVAPVGEAAMVTGRPTGAAGVTPMNTLLPLGEGLPRVMLPLV